MRNIGTGYVDLEDKKNEIINYYKEYTLGECGKKFGCCGETIRRRLEKWGIHIRDKKESQFWFGRDDEFVRKEKQRRRDLLAKLKSEGKCNNFYGKRNPSFKGDKNGRWKGGNSSLYWKQKILSLRGERCEICGFDSVPEILNVHHKDYNKKNTSLENGQVLCPNCHFTIHFKERKYR